MLEPDELKKGWFIIPGIQRGDRVLRQQLLGLETLADRFKGRDVLDLGCAEGLIGRHCADAWKAASVDGVTRVSYEIEEAERQCAGRPMRFLNCDLRKPDQCTLLEKELLPSYHVVLLLSILHKVKDPMRLLEWAVRFARELVVIRLPAPTIDMPRCWPGVHPVRDWMLERFELIGEPETCVEPITRKPEWMGVFKVSG